MQSPLRLVLLLFVLPLLAVAKPEEFSSATIGIGVVVSDLDRSVAFYTDVIGMVPTGEFRIGEDFSKRSGLANGRPTQVKVLRLGEGREATQWKLMTFGPAAEKQSLTHIYERTGMRYITILVKDLTPILHRIKRHGVKLLGDTPVPLGADDHFILIQDPDDTFIELIGPLK